MRRTCRTLLTLGTLLASSTLLRAEQSLIRIQGWDVAAPDALDCRQPPPVTAKGPGTLFDAPNRAPLLAITAAIAPILQAKCPGLTEAVLVNGRTRRLISLALSGSSIPAVAAPPPVTPAAAAASAPPPTAAAAPSLPPATAPGPRRGTPDPDLQAAAPPPSAAVVAAATRYADRRLTSLEAAKKIDDKCELLLQWLGRVHQEFPDAAGNRYGVNRSAVNLFRDEDFRQVFGQPYDETTTKWRAEVHEKVIGRCEGLPQTSPLRARIGANSRGMATYASQFESFRPLLDGAFLSQAGQYSPQAINAAIGRARQARAWMDTTLADSLGKPPTAASYRELSAHSRGRRPELAALWPSEQRHFTEAIQRRQSEVAAVAAGNWVAGLARFEASLEGASQLVTDHRQIQDVVGAAGAPAREKTLAAYQSRLDAILEPLAAGRVSALPAIPATLAGADSLLEWKSDVDAKFKAYQDRPPVAAAHRAYPAHRQRVLSGALPEWKQSVEAAGKPQLAQLAQQFAKLFPSQSSGDPAFAEYRRVLQAGTEKQRQLDVVAAVGECDRLAAYPRDPDAAPGSKAVPDERFDGAAAIAACELAIQGKVAPPRLRFQLARGFLTKDRTGEAVEQLIAAADGGHGPALAFLGDLHLDGAPGIEADPELAYSLFERAVEAGFEPAKAILAQFEDFTDKANAADEEERQFLAENPGEKLVAEPEAPRLPPPNTKLINPEIVENIMKGELDAVPVGELYAKLYLANMAAEISEVCEAHLTKREVQELKLDAALKSFDLSPSGGLAMLMGGFMDMARLMQNPEAGVRRMAQSSMDTENLQEEAMKDAYALMNRHSCGSPEIEQFSKNLRPYVKGEGVPKLSTDELFAVCSREARPSGRYDAKNFCTCFVPSLSRVAVTRVERRGMATNFWPTAQKMMNKDPGYFGACTQGFGR